MAGPIQPAATPSSISAASVECHVLRHNAVRDPKFSRGPCDTDLQIWPDCEGPGLFVLMTLISSAFHWMAAAIGLRWHLPPESLSRCKPMRSAVFNRMFRTPCMVFTHLPSDFLSPCRTPTLAARSSRARQSWTTCASTTACRRLLFDAYDCALRTLKIA